MSAPRVRRVGHPTLGRHDELLPPVRRGKRRLVREARALLGAPDWAAAAERLEVLRREWDRLGSAGPRHDEQLRQSFEAAIEQFERRRPRGNDEQVSP